MGCELYECEVDGVTVTCQIVEMSEDNETCLIRYQIVQRSCKVG